MSIDQYITTKTIKRIDNKTVAGNGFQITVPDIHRVIYTDTNCTVEIEIEGGMSDGKIDWIIYDEKRGLRQFPQLAWLLEPETLPSKGLRWYPVLRIEAPYRLIVYRNQSAEDPKIV